MAHIMANGQDRLGGRARNHGTSHPTVHWWTTLLATTALVATAAFLPAQAQDATWLLNPNVPGPGVTFDFNANANWDPAAVPTGTAFFGATNGPDISFSSPITQIGSWTFNADAADYNFTNGLVLEFIGAGIVVNGGSATITNTGILSFLNESTAGSATITNNFLLGFFADSTAGSATITNNNDLDFRDNSSAGSATITNNEFLRFFDDSTAGDATIANNAGLSFHNDSTAGDATITNNSALDFFNESTAGNATITNNAGLSFHNDSTAGSATITNNSVLQLFSDSTAGNATITTTGGGTTIFVIQSSGGNARFITEAGGTFDISSLASTGTTAGSIAGAGSYFLGGKNLEVGSNDLSTEVSGVISGDGGSLTKVGSGVLTLSGASTYTGLTAIDAGALNVTGSLVSVVGVNTGGTLMGTGNVGGLNVNADETVAPGQSIGTLNVAGDVTFDPGSVFEVEVNAAGQSDLINATGIATLNGGTVEVLAQSGSYAPSTQYTILTAGGGVFGVFDDVTSDLAFLDPSLLYDANNVFLLLERTAAFASVAGTPNQRSVARALDTLPTDDPLFLAVLNQTAAGARTAFDALSGELHASIKGALLGDSWFVRDAISGRMRGAFGGVGAPTMPVLSYAAKGPVLAPADTDRFAVWGHAYGAWGRLDGDRNAARLDRSTGGFFLGADAPVLGFFAHPWRLGLAGGYGRSSLKVPDRSSSASVDTFTLAGYGGGELGAIGVRFGAAYSWHDIDSTRSIVFPGFSSTANASYEANTAQVFGEVGYAVDYGFAAFEPFANLAYVNLRTDGFEESGAAGLIAQKQSTDVTYTTLGLRAAAPAPASILPTTLHGTLGWQHAFGDVTPLATLALPGSSPFTVAGTPIGRDTALIQAGFDVEVAANATLTVSYNGQLASNAQQHGFTARLEARF